MAFHTRTSGSSLAERLRITSAGALQLSDTASPNDQNTDIWVASDVLNFNAFGTNGAFIFKTGSSSTERLRITSDGDLKFNQTQSKINLNTSDGSDNKYLSIGGGGDASQSRGAGVTLYGNEVTDHQGRLQLLAGNSGNANGVIQMHTAGSERMRITSAGLVGIGTDGPAQPFTSYAASGYPVLANGPSNGIGLGGNGVIVFGTYNLGAYAAGGIDASDFEVKISGTQKFHISSSGKVGIGVDDAHEKLDVRDGDIILSSTNAGSAHRTSFIEFTGDYARINSVSGQGSSSASNYAAGWNITTRNYTGSAFETLTPITIEASGKIGINSTSPANELIVMTKGGSGHSCAKVVSGNGATALTMQVIQGAEARLGTDSGAPLALYSNGNEFARFQTTGELTLGTTTDAAPDGFASKLQVNSSNHTGSITIGRHTANANGPAILFNKTRSGSNAPSNGAVSNDDSLGVIRWYGSDGTDYNSSAAQIACLVDNTPGTNDMPGRITMGTTGDGESSPKESWRLDHTNSITGGASGLTQAGMDNLTTGYAHMPSWTQGANNLAGDAWTTVLNVGTSEATWDLVSFEGSTNSGLWCEITCYFSQITAGKAGRQRVSYRIMRTGNNNFGTSVDGPYDKVGTDTSDHFTPSITTTGSGSGMRAKFRVTTTSLVNYCMTIYHIRWVAGDYMNSPYIIV